MPLEAKAAPRPAKVAGGLYPTHAHRVNYALGQKNRGGKGRSTRIQLRTAGNDQSRQTEVPEQSLGGR
jgi:hypothetical protein